MHVAEIRLGASLGAQKRRPFAYVCVLDDAGNPVYGATVTGNWSGCFNQNGSSGGPTGDIDLNNDNVITDDEKGWVRITAGKTVNCSNRQCPFNFAVTAVTNDGYTYDASQNVETTDSVRCNPLLP